MEIFTDLVGFNRTPSPQMTYLLLLFPTLHLNPSHHFESTTEGLDFWDFFIWPVLFLLYIAAPLAFPSMSWYVVADIHTDLRQFY